MNAIEARRLVLATAAVSLLSVMAASAQEQRETTVTPTLEQRAANFDKSDANKDGALDRKEFATTPRAQPPADADEVFAVSDLNKDGKVTKAEFLDPNFGTLPPPPK
jgi:Ca2+-binding EF-hand superfamily protein